MTRRKCHKKYDFEGWLWGGGGLQKNAGKEEAGWQLKSTYKILVLSALIKAYE